MDEVKGVKRAPVDFRYDAINWDFVKMMARLAAYADGKYGTWDNYFEPRLTGEKSPINHIYEHLRQYTTGELHDHFTDRAYHMAAIAYNAMMEVYYLQRYGFKPSPFNPTEQPKVNKIAYAVAGEEVRKGDAVAYKDKAAEYKRQCQIAMENGYASHQVGKRLCDNPNARGSQDAAYWEEGWRKRHHELCYGKEWGTK
jgi:hypothetical protein